MKDEIERRRAEAAEKKRQKEESAEDGKSPFKCLAPKGASTKVGGHLMKIMIVIYIMNKTLLFFVITGKSSLIVCHAACCKAELIIS